MGIVERRGSVHDVQALHSKVTIRRPTRGRLGRVPSEPETAARARSAPGMRAGDAATRVAERRLDPRNREFVVIADQCSVADELQRRAA